MGVLMAQDRATRMPPPSPQCSPREDCGLLGAPGAWGGGGGGGGVGAAPRGHLP